MLNNYLNPTHLSPESISKYKSNFAKAKPYKHLLIENILAEDKGETLLNEVKKEEFIEKESDLFQIKQTHDLHFAKSKQIKDFHNSLLTWDFFNWLTAITEIKLKGTLHLAATLYESTDFLLCHDDKLEGRKIALLFYLSKEFSEKDGGSFVMYNSKGKNPTSVAKKIPPKFNSLLMFEVSSKSFHEVEENYSDKSRYTIGGWAV